MGYERSLLVKLLQKYSYDFVFCGNLSSIGKMIIASISKNKVFLLDDGAVTINHYLSELNKDNRNTKYPLKKKIRHWRFNLFGLKTIPTDTINLFTSYQFVPRAKEQIVHNNLTYFKQTVLSHTIADETVYLLGQPLADIQLINRETYLNYVQKIQNFYQRKLVYIPHRAESVSDDLIRLQDDNFTIQEIHQPIELEFINSHKYPKYICSFYSSALFTLNILYPESEIIAFVIEPDKMVFPRPEIKNVYDYAATKTTIKTINLKEL